MTRWSAITRTPPQLLRARLRLALHSSGGKDLNRLIHHERGRYSGPGTARRLGSGKRDGKVYVRNQRRNAPQAAHQLEPGGWGLGRGARPLQAGGRLLGRFVVAGREATLKCCGVGVAMPQGYSWAPPAVSPG